MKIELTEKENELITSALLFMASCDVSVDITDTQRKKLITLAKKVGTKKVTTAYVYGSDFQFDDETLTKQILKNFNIRREGI